MLSLNSSTFLTKMFLAMFTVLGSIEYCSSQAVQDGGWASWAQWSNCTQGMRTRTRSCDSPPPSLYGKDCDGVPNEKAECDPITPGGWGSWISWNSCSQTCGIGTHTRHRVCDNPVPPLAGDHCFGDNVEFRTCFSKTCVDGNWSFWSPWSSCTLGLRTRTRSCNDPPPSTFGRDCEGNDEEALGCTDHVAFTVFSPNSTLVDGRPIFARTAINVGGGYDPQTAQFTAPVAGLYEFTIHIRSLGKTQIVCWIQKNRRNIVRAMTSPDNVSDTASTSSYLLLAVGDVVNLGTCDHWAHVFTDYSTSFSGALVGY